MNVLSKKKNRITVEVSNDEYLFLYNSMNEVCNGIEIGDVEFQSRLGVSRDVGRDFIDIFSSVFPLLE